MSGADSEPQFNYLKFKKFLWKTVLQLWEWKSSTKLRENTHMSNKILILMQWIFKEPFNPNLKLHKTQTASHYSTRAMLIHTHCWELTNSWRTQHQILWSHLKSTFFTETAHIQGVLSDYIDLFHLCQASNNVLIFPKFTSSDVCKLI